MDLKEIQELIKIVDQSDLTTFELEKEGLRVVLKKEVEKIVSREMVQGGFPDQHFAGNVPTGTLPAEKTSLGKEETNVPVDNPTINSPIVGTFYSSSAPGEPPFIQPGGRVKKGDILCIIEAMKLMNEIEADEDLRIIDILVKDGQMVEYGQPLFVVSKI
jgi:acetyl-CoA carboxylase biotin carboxyl carrier protein